MSLLISGSGLVIAGAGFPVATVAPEATSPLELGEHPRFLLTASELADLHTITSTDSTFRTDLQAFVTWINNELSVRTADYMGLTWERATDYLLALGAAYHFAGGDRWNGTALEAQTAVPTITGLLEPSAYATRIKEVWTRLTALADGSQDGGKVALAYDWTHPALTAGERTPVIAWMTSQTISASATSHWSDVGDALAMEQFLLRAMVFKGDGVADTFVTANDKYDVWWRGVNGWATGHGAQGGTGSGWVQGMLYGNAYHAGAYGLAGRPGGACLVEECARTAFGLSHQAYYSHADGRMLAHYPRYVLRNLTGGTYPTTTVSSSYAVPRTNGYQYLWRPGELTTWQADTSTDMPGKSYCAPASRSTINVLRTTRAITRTWLSAMSQLAQWLLDTVSGPWTAFYPPEIVYLIMARGGYGQSTPASPAAVAESLSMFGPEGHWTFRTDWTTREAPVVMVLSQKWTQGDYGFRHVGEIQMFRKGPVLHRRTFWGAHSHKEGASQGSSFTFPTMSATRLQLTGSTTGDVLSNAAPYLGIERTVGTQTQGADMVDGGAADCLVNPRQWLHDGTSDRDVDYLWLDLYTAYDSYSTKLNSFVRQVVYFRPATVSGTIRAVVFDRPSVKSPYNWGDNTGSYAKMQGWSTAGEPTFVDGTSDVGPSRGPSGTAGKWHTLDGTRVTCTNTEQGADSTLHLTVIRPTTNRRIVKMGGPNASAQYLYYTVGDAANWSHITDQPHGYAGLASNFNDCITPNMAGVWHLYVEDLTTNAQTVFVTALEVTDAGGAAETTEAVTGSGFTGVRIGDRIAVFGETSDALTTGTFTIPSAGTYKVLIGGLAASTSRTVSVSGGGTVADHLGASSPFTVSAAGTLYLTITCDAGAAVTIS